MSFILIAKGFVCNIDLFVAQPPVNHSLTRKPPGYKNNDSHATVIKRLLEVLQTRINTGFLKHFKLFKLGVSFVVLNYICLSFMQIHATFYFNYINYSGLLIFCCQNVVTDMIKYFQSFVYKYPEIPNKPMKKHHPISDEFLSYAFLFFYL